MIELKSVLENAIKEESYFTKFYTELAHKASDKTLRSSLLILADQEKLHKEKLETLSFAKLGTKVVAEKLDDAGIKLELNLPNIQEFLDIESMFEFAIQQEVAAMTLYDALEDAVDDDNAKMLFALLAGEERTHHQLLAEALDNIRSKKHKKVR